MSFLRNKIETGQARVAVIGLGYVGLPLALNIVRAGFQVLGIDVDHDKVAGLMSGRSHVIDVSDAEVAQALATKRFSAAANFAGLEQTDVVIICVPTPLRKSKDPDISYIVSAMEEIEPRLQPDTLIILESTTYPGTSDELIAAQVEAKGYAVGQDVFVCFSPERVDPGNQVYKTENTPKIVGGVTPACTRLGALFYSRIVEKVFPVSSARVAETAKLLENTFRSVNIALVNEMALMCERMEIDVWEVIQAAATKPFGFMAFYPGPGIGGHCIPLDPMYLAWKAKSYGFQNKFIELASDINANMPRHVVAKVAEALNLDGKAIQGADILVLGMAYKKDVSDTRESPSLEVFRLLQRQGAQVAYHDPYVAEITEDTGKFSSIPLTPEQLAAVDCVVLATDHSQFDYPAIARHARLIIDTRNAFSQQSAPHILRLGAPVPSLEQWREWQGSKQEVAVADSGAN